MPVSTGRDSSRLAARLTREIVSSSGSASSVESAACAGSGRRGKSSTAYVRSRDSEEPLDT